MSGVHSNDDDFNADAVSACSSWLPRCQMQHCDEPCDVGHQLCFHCDKRAKRTDRIREILVVQAKRRKHAKENTALRRQPSTQAGATGRDVELDVAREQQNEERAVHVTHDCAANISPLPDDPLEVEGYFASLL